MAAISPLNAVNFDSRAHPWTDWARARPRTMGTCSRCNGSFVGCSW
jgi:hypothetical protein